MMPRKVLLPVMRRGAVLLSLASICAPMLRKGRMMRAIGRELSEASPVSTELKG
ncbi:hypothetical protein D3C83_60800 [compost metagenome]